MKQELFFSAACLQIFSEKNEHEFDHKIYLFTQFDELNNE